MTDDLDYFAGLWDLIPAGEAFKTHSSTLLPVRLRNGRAAMLKVARAPEEQAGNRLMSWWNGHGAAEVIHMTGAAILLERAEGVQSLEVLSQNGQDAAATQILCSAISTLHRTPGRPPGLIPLRNWFEALLNTTALKPAIFEAARRVANDLLQNPVNQGVLHGDIHHGNVLQFGNGIWKVIDPKGLWGERTFDYANLFCNPDHDLALDQFEPRLKLVSELARIPEERLLQWILSYAALSAVWFIQDGQVQKAAFPLKIAEKAADEMDRRLRT